MCFGARGLERRCSCSYGARRRLACGVRGRLEAFAVTALARCRFAAVAARARCRSTRSLLLHSLAVAAFARYRGMRGRSGRASSSAVVRCIRYPLEAGEGPSAGRGRAGALRGGKQARSSVASRGTCSRGHCSAGRHTSGSRIRSVAGSAVCSRHAGVLGGGLPASFGCVWALAMRGARCGAGLAARSGCGVRRARRARTAVSDACGIKRVPGEPFFQRSI